MPRTSCYSSDSGKHSGSPSGGSTGVPSADGGFDDGRGDHVAFESDGTEPLSGRVIQQYHTVFEHENLVEAFPGSDSATHGGSNAPYADQRKQPGQGASGTAGNGTRDMLLTEINGFEGIHTARKLSKGGRSESAIPIPSEK